MESRKVRRDALRSTYGFDCQCNKCVHPNEGELELQLCTKHLYLNCAACEGIFNNSTRKDLITSMIEDLQHKQVFPIVHLYITLQISMRLILWSVAPTL